MYYICNPVRNGVDKISTLTLHFKDIEAPDRCSGDLGPCVLGNFVAI